MHLQAITTKYMGPTNHRGSRIKASAYAGSVTVQYDSRLNTDANHARAAIALCRKYEWAGTYASGGNPDGNVYVCIGVPSLAHDLPSLDGFSVSMDGEVATYGNAHK